MCMNAAQHHPRARRCRSAPGASASCCIAGGKLLIAYATAAARLRLHLLTQLDLLTCRGLEALAGAGISLPASMCLPRGRVVRYRGTQMYATEASPWSRSVNRYADNLFGYSSRAFFVQGAPLHEPQSLLDRSASRYLAFPTRPSPP